MSSPRSTLRWDWSRILRKKLTITDVSWASLERCAKWNNIFSQSSSQLHVCSVQGRGLRWRRLLLLFYLQTDDCILTTNMNGFHMGKLKCWQQFCTYFLCIIASINGHAGKHLQSVPAGKQSDESHTVHLRRTTTTLLISALAERRQDVSSPALSRHHLGLTASCGRP